MGGGADTNSVVTTQQAQFIQYAHQQLIWYCEVEIQRDYNDSPWQGYPAMDLDNAFFGLGFSLSSFPSLYDMYGKFMAGLDVDALYNQLFLDTTTGPLITNLVAEQAVELADDVEQNILPRFETGMRDINAVMSSTYIVGKALIEAARIKALSKFDAELRYKLIPEVGARWGGHLNWNKNVVEMYGHVLKLYISSKIDTDSQFMEFRAKDYMWNWTLFDNYRLAIGATAGGSRVTTDALGGTTQTQKALGGAMTGAAIGTEINAGWGTAIGAVVGAAAGYFM